jgi:hypothetical protein
VARLAQSSFLHVLCMHFMSFLASAPYFYNLCHHGLLTCKRCNMSSLGLSGISASSCSDKGRDPVSCRFRTIFILLVADLAFLLPYTARMLDIHTCGVLPSCMWYTKQLLVCPYSYSGLAGTLSSSNIPSTLQ